MIPAAARKGGDPDKESDDMATKRIPPKPTPSAAKAGGGVIRRSGPVTAAPAPAASATEARAEREEAVQVAPSVQDLADWAPPPAQMSWWERMLGFGKQEKVEGKAARKAEMVQQMAAVKAGVMHELETMGIQKGVAVKGSPFSTVLLPVAPKKSKWKWPLVIGLAAALVGIMVWIGRTPDQPGRVLEQAVTAVRQHDVRTFEDRVDVAGVASSIVNQMFSVPQEGGDSMAARMTGYIKPGLADTLKDEILAAVGGEEVDADGTSLLAKIWREMGDGKLRVGLPRVAMQDERMVVAELPVARPDLGTTLPLQVVLTRTVDGGWLVTDVPNLAAVVTGIVKADREAAAQRAVMDAKETALVGADIRIESVKKAKDSAGSSSNLILSMVVANTGTRDARDVPLEVAFGDAAGQPMMTARLVLEGELKAGARREQVWSVPVNRAKAAERYVADLPLSALTVAVTVR